ncbi:MAG: ADP-ribosylglycohydrolase family protein [Tabrizicola sp.]|jgi:ADP-ribosylglycohydrolase|nr:ADP-ribosylglycohydrolase family protein [Tabrizicola sp.]
MASRPDPDRLADRALAALTGVALGDAMGMPAQTLDRDVIQAAYGRITGLIAPMPGHPVSHGLKAGQVTDDTEQTILLARRLLSDAPDFDAAAWGRDLMDWEAGVATRGLHDLLGPSTKAALAALARGVTPQEAGRNGATNGAAMRIVPVGIATLPDPGQIASRVLQVSQVTHGRGEALAAASAVAMVVSQGLEGASFEATVDLALVAARKASPNRDPAAHAAMADRIALALDIAPQGEEALARKIGTSVQSLQSVACAFGIVRLANGDPWQSTLIAANIGDDTDTIGAIACAMAAACTGMSGLPSGPLAKLHAANALELQPLARDLLRLRGGIR